MKRLWFGMVLRVLMLATMHGEKPHHFFRRLDQLLHVKSHPFFGADDEFSGMRQFLVLHVKMLGTLAYLSVYRFENDQGCIVLKGDFWTDPWEIIPITFIRVHKGVCNYLEITGESEYLASGGQGYKAYDHVLSRLREVSQMAPPDETASDEYFKRVPKEDHRLCPLMLTKMFRHSPEERRQRFG